MDLTFSGRYPGRWRREHVHYAEHAFSGNGDSLKSEVHVAELERMVGQLMIENTLLKKRCCGSRRDSGWPPGLC